MKKVIVIFFLTLTLTGCGQKELESRDFVTIMTINKDENYNIAVSIANINNEIEKDKFLYKAGGNTINSCMNKIDKQSSGDLFLGHLQCVIVGENCYSDILKLLNDNSSINRNIPVLYCKNIDDILVKKPNDISLNSFVEQYFDNYRYSRVTIQEYAINKPKKIPQISIDNEKYYIT